MHVRKFYESQHSMKLRLFDDWIVFS